MKYLLLVYSNPQTWDSLSEEDREAVWHGHAAVTRELIESGEHVTSEGLSDPTNTRTVRVRGGVPATTDGPYAEAKEHLAGFYLIDCDLERALEVAAKIPDASITGVEVRPVMDTSGMEM